MAIGGAERYTRDLARLCQALGYETEVYQFGDSYWEKWYEGIRVRAYPWNNNPRDCIERVMKADLAKAEHVIYMSVATQQQFKSDSIAICHGIWFDNPQFTTQYGLDAANYHVLPALRQTLALVTVDLSFLEYCRCILPRENNNKIKYIPNYVDTSLFLPGSRAADGLIEILYPRRLDPDRGMYIMQAIIPYFLEKYPQVRFNFAVERSSRFLAEWQAWVQNQPQRERIRYAHYEMDEMPSVYRQADIVVVPSLCAEGTPFAVLEAMACAKAVVVSNVGGVGNLVLPGFNGKIVNPTQDAIAQAIEEYIQSEAERQLHGENGRRVVDPAFAKVRWEREWTELFRGLWG